MKTKVFLQFFALLLMSVLLLTSCMGTTTVSGGKSAYEIAVDNGFKGTEQEWLASLKADSPSVESLYEAAQQAGFTGSMLDFLKEYMQPEDGEITIFNTSETDRSVAKPLLASVSVTATHTIRTTNFWGQVTTSQMQSSGSGVIYQMDKGAGDAYIITNHHVVYQNNSTGTDGISDNIHVYLYGTEGMSDYAIPASYVGGSMTYDIAVLKITGSTLLRASDAQPVTVSDSNLVTVGTDAIAIGNAEGAGISVTKGIISIDSEQLTMTAADDKTAVTYRVMRIDAAVNSGNSGGGLFNSQGELIGIVNAKISDSSVENIAFAIPSNIAVSVAQNIIDNSTSAGYASVHKCMLGVTVGISASEAYYDADAGVTRLRETVMITNVSSDGLAAGLLESGDILKSCTIHDTTYTLDRSFILVDLLLQAREGDTISLTVLRNGTEQTVSVALSASGISQIP